MGRTYEDGCADYKCNANHDATCAQDNDAIQLVMVVLYRARTLEHLTKGHLHRAQEKDVYHFWG